MQTAMDQAGPQKFVVTTRFTEHSKLFMIIEVIATGHKSSCSFVDLFLGTGKW